jgi:ATP phosphoribosyltransferase
MRLWCCWEENVPVRIALPKGRLLEETAGLLKQANWGLGGYNRSMRSYRLESKCFPDLRAKVFNERDIPIQVAVGNYDLGICGLDWVEELSAKYPSSALVKIRDLEYGRGVLCLATSKSQSATTLTKLGSEEGMIRIASEYPNLAEYLALNLRLRRFGIFPLWGAAEVYPPENAILALVSCTTEEELLDCGLAPISTLLHHSAFLIASKSSWEQKDLSAILDSLDRSMPTAQERLARKVSAGESAVPSAPWKAGEDTVRLALPDGHQQAPIAELLARADIRVYDYPSSNGNRRPGTNLNGVVIKVIRPQDMPLQVANGNFDMAITGRDWLTDHLTMFPGSPVTELLDLKSGRVRMVAVVSKDVPADDVYGLRQLVAGRTEPFRVASEYVNIADKYARENRLGMYKVVPTWGATEAFLPEDADMLIENTETGRTIARHNLKIIDTLFESTACLIGGKDSTIGPVKQERISSLVDSLRVAVEGS